jgi:hypothetical protein
VTPRLPSTAALAILAVLAGCKATAPARDDARIPAPVAVPAAEPPAVPAPPPAATSAPDPAAVAPAAVVPAAVAPAEQESPRAVSAPPCTCAQPAPKPRPKRKKQRAPASSSEPQSVGPVPPPPANAVVDAEVGRVDAPLTSILGKDVFSPKGENLGRIVDLLSDPEGRVRVAIIDFGGFLGVGSRRIAVDWPLLHFTPADKDKPLMLTVTREKLQSAPEYKDASSPRVLMPPATDPDASGAHSKK